MRHSWEIACFSMPNNLQVGPLPLLYTSSSVGFPFKIKDAKDKNFGKLVGQPVWLMSPQSPFVVDRGAPEVLLLGVRAARQAVAENPQDAFSHFLTPLILRNSGEMWVAHGGEPATLLPSKPVRR